MIILDYIEGFGGIEYGSIRNEGYGFFIGVDDVVGVIRLGWIL